MFDFIVERLIRVLFKLKGVKIEKDWAIYGIEIHNNKRGVVYAQAKSEWM